MKRDILSQFAAVRNRAAAGCAAALMALAALAAGCSPAGPDYPLPDDTPEGYARVEVRLTVKGAPEYATRASYLIDEIDNVNLFWFSDDNNNNQIDDSDKLVERRYFEYGTRQDIFLKRDSVYYVYAVANLDDSYCPNGNLATYFDDVENYGELKKKYILNLGRPTNELSKIVMAADKVTRLTLPSNPDPNALITPEIKLERIPAMFVINIYNRVDPVDRRVLSYVNPVSMNGVDFIRGSYLLPREDEDFSAASGYTGDVYFQPGSESLVANGTEPLVEYPASGSGAWYTLQTFTVYTFENRKGSVPAIDLYDVTHPGAQDVYGRYELAPEEATHLRISSIVGQDAPDATKRGKVLFTWVHAGKGRNTESGVDDVTNFDVDRNTVYHFNIVINGIDNVTIDSRRDFLDQMILFELPNAADRIDAHYVDMPGYISGNAKGMVKIQSGTGTLSGGGVPDWTPMKDTDPDEERWLRFSIYDPQSPGYFVDGAPVTWYTPSASTAVYVDMPESGLSKRRLLLHFNENVSLQTGTGAVRATTNANGSPVANDPPYRTALVRVGFVDGVHTEAEYEAQAAAGNENVFYQPVRQYGLKTIGAVGGYAAGSGYTKLLGVESVEETQSLYYTASGLVDPPHDVARQIFWQYRSGSAGNTNHSYDGMAATRAIYNDYRGNNVPPQRGQNNVSPATGLYNPFTNTNAADYCMRKNRDENGDGIISGAEVKWYLPTPVQMSQLFQWKGAFLYPLNQGYLPLGASTGTNYYWTTNESEITQAFVSTFTGTVNTTVAQPKANRNAVRCVRDIDGGDTGGMFYVSEDGHLIANLTGHLPNLNIGRYTNNNENYLREQNNNSVAPAFIISRWYTTENGAIVTPPSLMDSNGNLCGQYSETGYPIGRWWPPSERELAVIYTYADMLNNMLAAAIPGAPLPYGSTDTFHYLLTSARHWGFTNIGSNNNYWYIDFATGASNQQHKGTRNAYMRCVRYLDPEALPQ